MTGGHFACQPVAGRAHGAHVVGMADKDKAKAERLAAALRENLRKRKAQSRELAGPQTKDGANGAG